MTDETPMKRCSKCKKWFLATEDHFYPRKDSRDGLRNECKACKNNSAKERRRLYAITHQSDAEIVVHMKRCSRGDQCAHPMGCWQPATEIYFTKNIGTRDGFHTQCKACKRVSAQNDRKNNAATIAKRTHRWRQANRKRTREYKSAWRRAHPVENRVQRHIANHRRLARSRSLPNTFTSADWDRVLQHFGACVYCGAVVDTYHADHFIPLSSPNCPGSVPQNMVCACPSCNVSKHNREPRAWLRGKFGNDEAELILARIIAFFSLLTE